LPKWRFDPSPSTRNRIMSSEKQEITKQSEVYEDNSEEESVNNEDDREDLEPYKPYPLPNYPDIDSTPLEILDVDSLKERKSQLEHALDKIEKLDQVLKQRDQVRLLNHKSLVDSKTHKSK
jgi:hypothetical protein